MFAAILAVVGAIVGLVGNIVGGENNKFLQRSAEIEARVQFERDKDTALYGMYAAQTKTRNIIMIAGVIFLLGLVYMLAKNKK